MPGYWGSGMICGKRSGIGVAVVAMVGALWVGCPPAAAVPVFAVLDLGSGNAYAVSDNGYVAGTTSISGTTHAVRWDPGVTPPTDLGAGRARGINGNGQVAGRTAGGDAARWEAGATTPTVLGVGDATGINQSGQMAGFIGSGTTSPVRWEAGATSPTPLNMPPGSDRVAVGGINDGGQIAGAGRTASSGTAVRWDSDGTAMYLGGLGNTVSLAYDVNNSGQTVGYLSWPSYIRAVRWDVSGTPTDLGAIGTGTWSIAYGINDNGWTVGMADTLAALWIGDQGYFLTDLLMPGSGWTLYEARAVNASGQIVGYGLNPSGQQHAFLLTPQNQGPQDVPEPSSLALLASTLLPAAGFLYRRRAARRG